MTIMTGHRRDHIVTLVAAAAFLSAVAFGLVQRWQFVGSLYDLGHQWLSGVTVVAVDNWMQDGFRNDSGSLIEIPASIEFKGIQDRSPYVSYPPGAQMEIWLVKKLFRGADTTTLLHLFGLANHIAIAIICYLIATSFSFHVAEAVRRIFAALSAILYLLLPIPYYWHATVFFADQAVILPFALALYLEALIRTKPKSWHFWVQSVILGGMAYIDWLVIPLAVVLFGFRLLSPIHNGLSSRVAQAAHIFFGPAIAVAIHLAIVLSLHRTSALIERFFFRTAVSDSGAAYVKNFFEQFFVEYLGWTTTILIGLTATFFAVRFILNRRDQVAVLALLGILSCLFQVLLLRNHSVIHSFSALKFILPLCYATFALLPLCLLESLGSRQFAVGANTGAGQFDARQYLPTARLAACLMGVFVAGYLLAQRNNWQDMFPPTTLTNSAIARWLRANANYNDVFVSTGIEIRKYPPQVVALSRKLVWKFDAAPALQSFVSSLPAGAVVHLIRNIDGGGCAENAVGESVAVVDRYAVVRVQAPLKDLANCMYPGAGPA